MRKRKRKKKPTTMYSAKVLSINGFYNRCVLLCPVCLLSFTYDHIYRTNSQASCKSLIALIVVVCIVILLLVIENIVCVLLYKKKLLTIDKWWKRTAHRQGKDAL